MTYAEDLALAHRMADAADAIAMGRFLSLDLVVETKPDLTPVSDADRDVEEALRAIVTDQCPGDSVIGEEYGKSGDSRRTWIIDPIDGTKNFVRGVPVWATLIALVDGDPATGSDVVVGVVSAPALGRRWWAARGSGAWVGPCGIAWNTTPSDDESVAGKSALSSAAPRQLHVSSVASLEDASLSFSGVGGWAQQGRLPQFLELAEAVWRTRAYGDFWSYMLVAEGAVDVSAEPDVSLWDLAALTVIVEEAGGRFTNIDGTRGPDGGSGIASNALLHDRVVELLAIR